MNTNDWLNVMQGVPALVTSIEQVATGPGNSGAKFGMVVSAIAPIVPQAELAEKVPAIGSYVSALVSLYNLVGFFKHNPTAAK